MLNPRFVHGVFFQYPILLDGDEGAQSCSWGTCCLSSREIRPVGASLIPAGRLNPRENCDAWEDRVLFGPQRDSSTPVSTFSKTARTTPGGTFLTLISKLTQALTLTKGIFELDAAQKVRGLPTYSRNVHEENVWTSQYLDGIGNGQQSI